MKRIKGKSARVITLSLLLALSLVGLSLMLARPRMVKAATLTVTSPADSGPGTLRQAIIDAVSGDTINFAVGITTITLTTAELLINKNLTISGPGANLLTVQRSTAGATPNFRILDIASGNFSVTISGLTITNGNSNFGGGAILNQSSGALSVTGCAISGNSGNGVTADGNGATGVADVTNSLISNNGGAGIGALAGGIGRINNCDIFANTGTGASVGAGEIDTWGNNRIFSNGTDACPGCTPKGVS